MTDFQASDVDGAVALGDDIAAVGGAADSHDGVPTASVGKGHVEVEARAAGRAKRPVERVLGEPVSGHTDALRPMAEVAGVNAGGVEHAPRGGVEVSGAALRSVMLSGCPWGSCAALSTKPAAMALPPRCSRRSRRRFSGWTDSHVTTPHR
jgi:hypothetical protein